MTPGPTVTHLFDAAETGKVLVRMGREQGHNWKYRPIRDLSHDGNPWARYVGALGWNVKRILDELPSDLIHLHYGRHTKYLRLWPRRPYVLHFHGTDIRHHFLQAYAHDEMMRASASAKAILYSTPDLEENSLLASPDAQYFPVPIDPDTLPDWEPVSRPTIVFSSRWDDKKNARHQLQIAEALVAAAHGDIDVQGIDWGDSAGAAASVGVQLVPRMPRAEYLQWLSRAHVVVGQSAGVLATSELEAIGIGLPVVIPLHPSYSSQTPVIKGATVSELVDAAMAAIADPAAASRGLSGRAWFLDNHDARKLAIRLAGIYDRLDL